MAAHSSLDKRIQPRTKQRGKKSLTALGMLETNRILRLLLFFTFSALVILICFVDQFPLGLQAIPNQVAKIRIDSDFSFTYESQIRTERMKESLRQKIAPVYSVDESSFEKFKTGLLTYLQAVEEAAPQLVKLSEAERRGLIEGISHQYEAKTQLRINPEDTALIIEKNNRSKRTQIFNEGLILLRDIIRDGVIPSNENEHNDGTTFFSSIQIEGRLSDSTVQSETDAVRYLSLNLGSLDIDFPVVRALFRILRPGIRPNLVYEKEKTEKKKEAAVAALKPVQVEVKRGQTIIEPGSIIGPEQLEQLKAYRSELSRRGDLGLGFIDIALAERSMLTFAILFCAILYIGVGLPRFKKSNSKLAAAALIMLLNLLIIRIILELGDTELIGNNSKILSVLPFCAPIAIAPMLITILIGPRPAVLIGILVSTFYALMLGSITAFIIISLVTSLVGIHFCRDVRLRGKVVQAGAYTGCTLAFCAIVLASLGQTPIDIIIYQASAAILMGFITGIIVIGLLPMIENLFKFTTDITLLELTDFNHPLLRRLQIEAPGTYHHSLMVANLSERAAVEINANPLICRACSLFHDIGKLIKPEYFVENQSSGTNPHMERNPSMSALVIKSHVKEGLTIARRYKLPKVVCDVIQQHHGTTLIQYFFDKALKAKVVEQEQETGESPSQTDLIEESTFRYDGPKPNFKESAIIFFADSLEAASRTLRKPSSTNIDELIENIFKEKLQDHQLDECPLTFKELQQIKDSFSFTLLNMLHARIDYPGKDKENADSSQESSHTRQNEESHEESTPGIGK